MGDWYRPTNEGRKLISEYFFHFAQIVNRVVQIDGYELSSIIFFLTNKSRSLLIKSIKGLIVGALIAAGNLSKSMMSYYLPSLHL